MWRCPRGRAPLRRLRVANTCMGLIRRRRLCGTYAQEANVMSIVYSEDSGPVRHVVLNRPEKRNAMSQELLRALAAELRAAEAEDTVHCVVLRGEGPVFSAGVDLNELAA